jgi:hypothetical protein
MSTRSFLHALRPHGDRTDALGRGELDGPEKRLVSGHCVAPGIPTHVLSAILGMNLLLNNAV